MRKITLNNIKGMNRIFAQVDNLLVLLNATMTATRAGNKPNYMHNVNIAVNR